MWVAGLLIAGTPAFIDWPELLQDIERSSYIDGAPGSTLERDVYALIDFFNNTCTEARANKLDAANPYRGAFAQVSQWRQQQGWATIVQAHSDVAVQCRGLYMEGGEEFTAKHCFWNIQSLANETVYPSPQWTIVETCCERLERPVLRVRDAVWATTGSVGRVCPAKYQVNGACSFAIPTDSEYVPKLNCDEPSNELNPDCEAQTLRTQLNEACDSNTNCPKASLPIGVRSQHYFNAGLAVGDKGVIVRTRDGGYSWDCLRGCTKTHPELHSISANVRLGGFGYRDAYYNAQGESTIDTVDWTLLHLTGESMATGLDGVYWPDSIYMEGYAVGDSGSIVRILNGGVNGEEPDGSPYEEVRPTNDNDAGCQTGRTIRDVFFWNNHLSFFVGDNGFICRYGLEIQADNPANGPGINVDDAFAKTIAPRWDLQGADEQGLNWGRIIDNNDYMYSNLRAVFCLQIAELNINQWARVPMDPDDGITYSQHITCFAVGTHPGTAGTTSAILRYQSRAVRMPGSSIDAPVFSEDISWKPQNSMTTVPLNDIYCVKTSFAEEDANMIYCYAVGDGGLIRYTANGGVSPWRTLFSGVLENLNKVVIIGVTWEESAFGAGGSNHGNQAVVVGDNGRVLYTNDGGNTWEKLERMTPEHLVAVQFNAMDDFHYFQGSSDLSADGLYFDLPDNGRAMPFGNGIATGAVMYDWSSRAGGGSCGVGTPNTGGVNARTYDCRKPELSVVLRTNCGGTLQSSHWRCQSECQDKAATVPVSLENTLADEATWRAYFGTEEGPMKNGVPTVVPKVDRSSGIALYARVPACDEVWSVGHRRVWHEDTRETRLFQSAEVDKDTGLFVDFTDTKAMRPAHEMCMYGWPRHQYMLDKGRRMKDGTNTTQSMVVPRAEYTFLNRLRHSRTNCTQLGGQYYEADGNHLEDCVFEFGTLTTCPSWEVHGMGHTLDPINTPVATRIPYVNFSMISDPCNDKWFGVTCEEHTSDDAMAGAVANQTVSQIWLYSNNLQGEVPSSVRDLHSLRSFSLGSNRLTGNVPRDVWNNMSNLQYLSIAENSLVGTIPETFEVLNKLEELRLHSNSLTGNVPSELGRLSYLQSLSLHANSLHGQIPSQLGNLTSLQYLWMSSNNFTGALPSELGRLSHLRYLWFANNSLESIPAQLGGLSSLRSLDGSNNSIADRLPYALGKLRNLRVMKFGRNRIRATIPDAIGMCVSLVVLELQHNELVGPLPASFGSLEELTNLDISHNLLERQLPESIDGMRSLQLLLLNDNNIEGGIPSSIGTLRNLAKLNIANNLLTEGLPDELADCDNLESIELQGNQIDGPLPAGIWRLQVLEYLHLTGNKVRGPLPEGIGYLAQIRELRLDSNLIDGTIPATLGDATTLEVVRMDDNLLSGSIPSTIGKLLNVQTLDIHKNALQGSIPTQISGMQSLLTLFLHKNLLTGQLPATIGNLSALRDLKVSHNELTGVIPASFGKLQALVRLAIDQNKVGGSIPEELGLLKERLKVLHLQGNRLNGLLPVFFKLEVFRSVAIDLANNELWCPLPAWPALNNTASCRHCPNDIYLDDVHRTCSDHGVCVDGESCRCDPKWTGDECNLLNCPSDCNGHGDCINEREPQPCILGHTGNESGVTAGLCENLSDDCVAAFHDCPQNGISVQVDSTAIVIAQEPKHNNIVYAKCICSDSYFGNDCSMPPLPPPTVEPWPDPYASSATSTPCPIAAALVVSVLSVAILRRPSCHNH